MAKKNRYIKPEEEAKKKKRQRAMPKWLKKFSTPKVSFGDDVAFRYIPYVVFLTCLGLIYIANNHNAEKLAGKITKIEREVKVLQMEYGTMKYEFMNKHNKARIAKDLKKMGLYPNDKPVVKVVVNQ
ncbi:MAG: FtsL-like putative cell division protein [Flammeovirgaceae bacterium]